jgi:hypothetical protein
MFNRLALSKIAGQLAWSPAVGILGPRQVGKTTLAQMLARDAEKSVYLDLDSSQALAQLANPSAWKNSSRIDRQDNIQDEGASTPQNDLPLVSFRSFGAKQWPDIAGLMWLWMGRLPSGALVQTLRPMRWHSS